jgi:SP family sugar:H+ symporter-like MFS transporter
MYRSGVKPWQSAGWKPHLMENMHKTAGGHDSDEKSSEEKPNDPSSV